MHGESGRMYNPGEYDLKFVTWPIILQMVDIPEHHYMDSISRRVGCHHEILFWRFDTGFDWYTVKFRKLMRGNWSIWLLKIEWANEESMRGICHVNTAGKLTSALAADAETFVIHAQILSCCVS
jgi:hypothetical protein